MSLPYILGIISTIALLAPVLVILVLHLYKYGVYFFLFIYCFMAFAYSLMTENIIPASASFVKIWGYAYNLLDAPLMMCFLLLFAKSKEQRKNMLRLTVLYAVYEMVVLVLMKGFNKPSITVIMGPGIALVLYYSFIFFGHRMKIAITHQKAAGKAIMISAILFAYVCFSYIYVIHYILHTNPEDSFFLYYLVSLIYNSVLTTGLVIEKKRLGKLKELKITRKELSEIFAQDHSRFKKTAIPEKEMTDIWRFDYAKGQKQ